MLIRNRLLSWRLQFSLAILLLISVFLAACSVGGSDAADIEDILVSGPTATDITATSAVILADTNIDVVCAVSFGITTDYGRLATDIDMVGTGHRDHHPLLLGLKPDTLYHFRLSGTGADGAFYISQGYTFQTLSADTSLFQEPEGDNLALVSNGARIADVSSNFGGADNSGAWGAKSAIDGDPSTQWSSAGDGDDAWIEIELPSETKVTSVGFWTRTMVTSAQIFSFRVVTDRGETYGPFEVTDAVNIYYFNTDLVATRLRFEAVESSGGNAGAVEIEVYGEPVP